MSEQSVLLDAALLVARWGWYLAVFLILGAGSYAPFLFRPRTPGDPVTPALADELARRAARIGLWAALALCLIAPLKLYLQALTLSDPLAPFDPALFGIIIDTQWGRGWRQQATLAGLAALAFFGAARGASRFAWMVATAASGWLGYATGLTGHANTAQAGPGGTFINAVHVWAGGLWLGGLAVLLLAGIGAAGKLSPELRRPVVVSLVKGFSRRALILAPLTVGFGVWLSARYLGWGWPLRFTEAGYTLTLGGKIAVLLGVAALGAYNWRVTQPGLARNGEAGHRRLRRFGALEVLLGIILLGITALLVALPLPPKDVANAVTCTSDGCVGPRAEAGSGPDRPRDPGLHPWRGGGAFLPRRRSSRRAAGRPLSGVLQRPDH